MNDFETDISDVNELSTTDFSDIDDWSDFDSDVADEISEEEMDIPTGTELEGADIQTEADKAADYARSFGFGCCIWQRTFNGGGYRVG